MNQNSYALLGDEGDKDTPQPSPFSIPTPGFSLLDATNEEPGPDTIAEPARAGPYIPRGRRNASGNSNDGVLIPKERTVARGASFRTTSIITTIGATTHPT